MTTLYVNVGRRDGVRAAELARIVRERTGLADGDIGKVRVRQRHTFVGIRTDRLEHAMSTLAGTPWGDRTISVEPAKAGRP
ncbi:MAG: DbpA RNA binding domain-containing protein [Micrococcales bacterium]|nr:DbpA RNA binding domain-containing protein [Micrococcales bacterium]